MKFLRKFKKVYLENYTLVGSFFEALHTHHWHRLLASVFAISKTFLVENGALTMLIFLKKIEFNFFTDIPWLI